MKKLLSAVLIVAALVISAPVAKAQAPTTEEETRALILQIIDLLQQQIQVLMAQIAQQNGIIATQSQTIANQQASSTPSQDGGNLGGQEDGGQPPAEVEPTLEVSVRKESTTEGGTPLAAGRHAIVVEVDGDWDVSRLSMWRPNGDLRAGYGFTTERQYWITDSQTGEYRWEVSVKKGDAEKKESGVFTVSP